HTHLHSFPTRRSSDLSIANPTATSTAATTITKNTNTCPAGSFQYEENATSKRFTALSISSTDMKIIIAFLRNKTPITPMQNKTRSEEHTSELQSQSNL